MTALLSLITGNTGSLAALAAIVGALLLSAWRMLSNAKKAGINEQLVKDAKARDKNIEDIIRAGDARPIDGVPDKHDRDTWK